MLETTADEMVSSCSIAKKYIDEQVIGKETALVPMLMLKCRKPFENFQPAEPMVIALNGDMNSTEGKAQVMFAVASFLVDQKLAPIVAVFMSEIWYAQRQRRDDGTFDRMLPSESNLPKEEAIMVAGLSYDGNSFVDFLPVTRDGSNNFVAGQWKGIARTPHQHSQLLGKFFRAYGQLVEDDAEGRS